MLSNILLQEQVKLLTAKKQRIDNRGLNVYRKISINKNIIDNADGSASIDLGNTKVIVGIKVEPGMPYPDSPNSGVLIVNSELIPLASPTFESGPPSPESIELARIVDRGLREAECIDLESLCIEPEKKVWCIFVDIHVLDHDGNLIDASALAALSALTITKIPAKRYNIGEDNQLRLKHYPIACTAYKIDSCILLDPTLNEEKLATTRLTITTIEDGSICAIQKGLGNTLTTNEILEHYNVAVEKSKELRSLIWAV